jgi:hypothetical protein
MIAGGAYAANVTIADMNTAVTTGHKTVNSPTGNTAPISSSIADANGKLDINGTQTGTSNTVVNNAISASSTATSFSNALDLALIEDDGVNSGLASLGVATNSGAVTSTVSDSSLSIDLTGFQSGTAVNTDNTIGAQSTANSGTTTIASTIPNGYVSTTEGSSTMAFPSVTDIHTANGSIVASSVQENTADTTATASGNAIGLALSSDLNNQVDPSPTLDRNTISAEATVNSATSTVDLQKGGAPAFDGSAVVTNLQTNLDGSASASNTGSSILATVTGTDSTALNKLDGGLSVQDNTISSSATGNQSTGTGGVAGNRILIGDQLSVHGAGTTGPAVPGSTVAYDAGDTAASSTADLVIFNSQGNTGASSASPLTISSTTSGNSILDIPATIGAVVDSLDGGSITVAGNGVTSQTVGNTASSAIQSGKNASEFDASVALLNQQVNYHADIGATTSDSAVTAIVGSADGGETNGSAVDVSSNNSAARSYGNDESQSIALEANTLTTGAGSVVLTGGTTGPTNDGNASASGAATITSLQASYDSNVTALNQNAVIGLDADTHIATPGDVIGSSALSTDTNTQEAVALGSNAANGISLTGETVSGGAGITNVQIGDANSSVASTLSGSLIGMVAGTHVEDSSLSVAGNLQRAIGYGTNATNNLTVDATSVDGGDAEGGVSLVYSPTGDPFHTVASQPAVNAAFGILNDQSLQSPVAASAGGVTGISVEGDLRGSTATNESNAVVAAGYGNDAANSMVLDAGSLISTDFASVGHVGNVQTVFGDNAAVSATVSAPAVLPLAGFSADGNVVLTEIEDNVSGSTVSTSKNQVQALAYGSRADNGLSVSGTTLDTSGATGVPDAGLTVDAAATPSLSGNTSFGVTNAQAGAGSVSASLLDNPADPTSSASVLTRIGQDARTISGSTVASDSNSLSAQATSNSADNSVGVSANSVTTTSGLTNFQTTDADVSALIGVPGQEYIAPTPFTVNANAVRNGYSESDGTASWSDGEYWVALTDLTGSQQAALEDQGWVVGTGADAGRLVQTFGSGSAPVGSVTNTIQVSGTTGGQSATPNIGGVTIAAQGDAIVASTLSVDSNKVNGAVTGNSATNTLSVAAGTIANGSDLSVSTAQVDVDVSTLADHSLANVQSVGEGTLNSTVAGSFGIAAPDDAAISGSTLSVSDNSQRSVSVANTAGNTLDMGGTDGSQAAQIASGSALVSLQGSDAAVNASSNVAVFAPGAASSSTIAVSGNTNTSLGVINDATNSSTISAANIATLDTTLGVGEVGNAELVLGSREASGDHVLENVQTATTSVDSTAVTSLYNGDQTAVDSAGLVNSTFTMSGNATYAEASANRASNTMALNGGATQGASGGLANFQDSSAAATASATTNAGLTLAGSTATLVSNSTVTVDNNSTTALAQGNTATNVLNSVAGANYGNSVDSAQVAFSSVGPTGTAHATAAVLNGQTNSGAVTAQSQNATYQVALNATDPNPGVTNGTVSVSGNSIAAQAFGNNATNKVSLTGLNTGTSTAALGSTQLNSGAITASVSAAQIGVTSVGSASSSSFGVGGNTISANAVGNSVSNAIRRN